MSAKLVAVYGNKKKNRVVLVYADGRRVVTTWNEFHA